MRKPTDHRHPPQLEHKGKLDFAITARLLNEMQGWMPGFMLKVTPDIDPHRLHFTWWRKEVSFTWTLKQSDMLQMDALKALAMKECLRMYKELQESPK